MNDKFKSNVGCQNVLIILLWSLNGKTYDCLAIFNIQSKCVPWQQHIVREIDKSLFRNLLEIYDNMLCLEIIEWFTGPGFTILEWFEN